MDRINVIPIHSCPYCKHELKTLSGINRHMRNCNKRPVLSNSLALGNAILPLTPRTPRILPQLPTLNTTTNNTILPNLPTFVPISHNPNLSHNSLNGIEFASLVDKAYEKIITWKKNVFLVPSGKQGKKFVSILSYWLENFNKNTTFRGITLKVFMILASLLLQKPSRNSKSKDHIEKLETRITLWESGNITDLVKEGENIQKKYCRQKEELQRILLVFSHA